MRCLTKTVLLFWYLTFTLRKTVEALCTACLNFEKFQILPKKCMCMFYRILAVYESRRIN